MELQFFILLAANILVPAIATYMCCVAKGLEVNHLSIFTFGFLFYWILPTALGASQLLAYNSQLKTIYYLFDSVSPSSLNIYLLISLGFYLSFFCGHIMSRGVRWRTIEKCANLHFDCRLLTLHLLLGTAVFAVYAYFLRDQLFKGYNVAQDQFISDPLGIRGPFAASCVFLEGVALVYTVYLEVKLAHTATFLRVIINRYMLVVLTALLLDLSLGQRHFILTAAFMLTLYRTVFFKRLSLPIAFFLFVTSLAAAGAAALIRQKVISFSPLEIIFVEPLFTSLALFYYLREAVFPLIRFPYPLIGDLVLLIPRALMPNKMALMSNLSDVGIPVFSPMGTIHSFLSFMANFGVLGSFGMAFLLGFVLNVLKSSSTVPLLRVIYIMLSAQLAFSFWRDPFAFSFVKGMLEFSILVPILICASSNVLSGLVRRKNLRIARRLEEFAL